MGCNCGKKSKDFKNLVQQAQTIPQPNIAVSSPLLATAPTQHVTRTERIK